MRRPLAALALIAIAGVARSAGVEGFAGAVSVFAALGLCPGLALLDRGGVAPTVAVSLAADALVASALLATGGYSPARAAAVLAAVCAAGGVLQIVASVRARPPTLELR